MWNRSIATLFILQASVLRICAFFFSYLQRKDVSSEGKLFCPTLKNVLKSAFCLLSLTCSLDFLVVFLLPIYLHCHTSTVFTFRSSSVPCQALGWRKVDLHKIQHKSQFERPQSLFTWTYINILWKKSIWSRGKASSCVYRSVCSSSVCWPQIAVTAVIPILRLRDHYGSLRDTTKYCSSAEVYSLAVN